MRAGRRSATRPHRPLLLALVLCALLLVSAGGVAPATAGTTSTTSYGWSWQTSGTTEVLRAVHFVDANTGWAVGDGGTILKTTNGGTNWTAQTSGTANHLRSVHFVDGDTGWAVGGDSSRLPGQPGTILKTTNGGTNWTAQTSGTSHQLNSVHFVDANTGWAVGYSGTVLKTSDGGSTWEFQVLSTNAEVSAVHFTDDQHGWVVTSIGLYKTVDGGETWPKSFGGGDDIIFVDRNTGWTAGTDLSSDRGEIRRSTDGGLTWAPQDCGSVPGLLAVHFADEAVGCAVGLYSTILATRDGGETWAEQDAPGSKTLCSVYFVDEDTGWAVGHAGTIVHYGPTAPADPTDPDTPTDPDDPTDPADPTDPNDPTDPTDPDGPGDGAVPAVINIAGGSRYETAVLASEEAFPDGADTVVIATGRNWPDALGGSALAGALDAPILLVNTASVPDVVTTEIARLQATRAVIVGGEVAVGPEVASALASAGLTVERVAGASRYETADAVALRVIAELGEDYDGTAFVATGGAYADAVAAGPLAAAFGWPLYLAHPTRGISDDTKTAMADVTGAVVLGGELAVSTAVESELKTDLGDDKVIRLAGGSRYETAVKIAEHGVAHTSPYRELDWDRVGIATGQAYPDALAGGVLQGRVGSVMLLTRSGSLDLATQAALEANKEAITTVTFFGGDAAVAPAVRTAVTQALE